MKALGKALAFVMLLALVGAGTATASKLITGAQIANGTVTGADIKNGTVKGKDLSPGAKASLQGAAGSQGPAGEPGAPGAAGAPGEPGSADRYALVRFDGLLQNDIKGIAQSQVTHAPGSGVYCFRFPTATRPKGGAANGTNSDTVATLQIDGDGGIAGCPANANVRVTTWDMSSNTILPREFRLMLEND
jgi:hypothetical protein